MTELHAIKLHEPFAIMTDNGADYMGEYPIMQYTGLRDKNGVAIYEGDILGYVREENDRDWLKGHEGMVHRLAARAGKVEFKNGKFVLHWHYGNTYGGIGEKTKISWHDEYNELLEELQKTQVIKVIGNIYENPELLV